MLALLFYTQKKISRSFLIFFAVCFIAGFAAELTGTATGLLFGEYSYGKTLGIGFKNVPFVIGVNWFIIMYCCGTTVHMLLQNLSAKLAQITGAPTPAVRFISVMSDGAMLAVLFDWVMEPAAIKLGYWQWLGNGEIPNYNYLTWFMLSALLMAVFNFLNFEKKNIFALNLLLIMMMFFMLVRTFL